MGGKTHATSHLMSSFFPNQCSTLLYNFTNAPSTQAQEAILYAATYLPYQPEWSAVSHTNHSSLWVRIPFTAAVVYSREILWVHLAVEPISAIIPNLPLNVWYLDEGTLVGSPEDL